MRGQTSIVAMGAETLCYSAVVFVVKNSGHGDEVSSIGAHLVFHENRHQLDALHQLPEICHVQYVQLVQLFLVKK